MHSILPIASLFSLCLAAAIAQNPCPAVPPQSALDAPKYLGNWYEIRRFPMVSEKGKCIKAEYSSLPNGHIKVDNRYIDNGLEVHNIGDATIPDPQNFPAVLSVTFRPGQPPAEYKIVETDYESYSLVYSCRPLGVVQYENFAWILSRDLTLAQSEVQRLEQKLQSYGVDISAFLTTDQSGCPK